MRWVTYRHPGSTEDRVGLVRDGRILGLDPGISLLSLLGDDGERLARAGERALSSAAEQVTLDAVRLRSPIPNPPTIRDFYAFEQHVAAWRRASGVEMDPTWYRIPVFYFTNPYATNGPDDPIAFPPGCRERDFELEVAAVVGRTGSDLAPEAAAGYIAGFLIMNDWSARDVQREEMQLNLGPAKGKDFATTLGPMLVTPDELAPRRKGNGYDLAMTASVNGREYSRANFSDIYWSFEEMLAFASRSTRIEPGDVIGSGTCGTGCIAELSLTHGVDRYPWLEPGDEVVLEVEVLGRLVNRVVENRAAPPLRA